MSPTVAAADPLPQDAAVSLGLPPTTVQIRVAATEDGHSTRIAVRAGPHAAEETIRVRASEARVERVQTSQGAVAVVRLTDGEAEAAALLVVHRGRPSIAWTGRLDLHGDPGERTADVLDLRDRTGDGHPDVVVGQAREGVATCGQPPAILFPRALDPVSGALRPVVLRRFAEGEEIAVSASLQSPGPAAAPVVRALRAVAASSALGSGEDATRLEPPHALVDGDPQSAWIEGRGGAGEAEFVALRFGGRMPIRAIALTPAHGPDLRAPRAVVLAGERGPRLRVALPEGAAGRVWVVPPAPLEWDCFVVAIAEAGGEPGARVGFAEIEAFTELDFEGGIDALVARLVRGEDGADRATEFLSRLGEPALGALAEAWPRLGAQGRLRALRVAATQARTPSEGALALLALGGADERAEVRQAALEALARAGQAGRARLVALAARRGPQAEEAARRLAEGAASFDVGPLLEAVDAEGGSERPWLRAAIARAIAGGDAGQRERLAAWSSQASVRARAAVALGMAAEPDGRALALRLVDEAREETLDFADRFRLLAAVATVDTGAGLQLGGAVPPAVAARIDAWLAQIARDAREWMLRAAALQALGTRAPEVARAALEDPYPRVRVAAIEALAGSDADVAALRARARSDAWPLVRVAALDALADRAQERETLLRAVEDDAPMVRRRAVEHLGRLRDPNAWPAIARRLADDEEWPGVTEASLTYVESLCVAEAGEALLAVIRRGVRPNAWEPDVEAAIRALRIAARLGGEAAARARAVAARGGEALQAALRQPIPEPCGGPRESLAGDPHAAPP